MKEQLNFMNKGVNNPTAALKTASGAIKMPNLGMKKKRLVDLSPIHAG